MGMGRQGAGADEIAAVYHARLVELCGVASAILEDTEQGRDAVQDAFARALRRRSTFRGDGPLEAWLWRIVVNTARSRRRLSGPPAEGLRSEETSAGEDEGTPEVRSLLAALPERQRLVLFLRYYADLDYRTIAEVLAISPGTVGATLSAGLAALRRRLEEVPV
jgi:RNA polymerase sigma-70 factor (ECF subfamily)